MRPLTFTAASGRGQVAPKQILARRDFLSLCGPGGNLGLQTQPHPGLANLQRTLSLLQSRLLSSHPKCVDWLICSLMAKSSAPSLVSRVLTLSCLFPSGSVSVRRIF